MPPDPDLRQGFDGQAPTDEQLVEQFYAGAQSARPNAEGGQADSPGAPQCLPLRGAERDNDAFDEL